MDTSPIVRSTFSLRSALRSFLGVAITIVAMLSAANSTENEPAPASIDAPRSKIVAAASAATPTPDFHFVGPAAVNPLSERSQRIKQGLDTPLTPGASPAGATPGATPN
jgi:hypothetical protein